MHIQDESYYCGEAAEDWNHLQSDERIIGSISGGCQVEDVFIMLVYLMIMSVFACGVSVYHMYAVPMKARRGRIKFRRNELQMVLSYQVGAGNLNSESSRSAAKSS